MKRVWCRYCGEEIDFETLREFDDFAREHSFGKCLGE